MNEFKVKMGQIRSVVDQEKIMKAELLSIKSEIVNVRNALRFKIGGIERIDKRLVNVSQDVDNNSKEMQNLASALESAANMYEKTENLLCNNNKKSAGGNPVCIGTSVTASIIEAILMGSTVKEEEKHKRTGSVSSDTIDDFNENAENRIKDNGLSKNIYHDKSEHDVASGTNKVIKEDSPEEKAFDDAMGEAKMESEITLAQKGKSYSKSTYEGKYTLGDENGTHVSAEYEVNKRDAYANVYGGIVQTDANGKTSFKPGVGAEIGAVYTGFTAKETAQLGNDNLGVYIESTQTVGRVGAAAEAKVGFDKTGVFAVAAGFSAEAIAGEATLKGGGKILGTDIGVAGSVNYGIGAHADIGYKDGKVLFDIGATLGVGASVKLEVDVSGTVEAIADTAKSVWDSIF